MHREKARGELHKNAINYFEQILETTSDKAILVRSLTSHRKNHSRKTNKTRGALLEKQGRSHLWRSSLDLLHMDVSQMADQQ